MKRFIDAIKSVNENAYCIFEYFVNASEENEIGNYGGMSWKKLTSAYATAAKGYSSGSSFSGMYSGDENRPFGSIVGFQESHDEQRVAYEQKVGGVATAKVAIYGMRRLSSNAAFMILVPGPKMIWQFGEMGYDISGGNGDVDMKAPHWEYLDNTYRKGLHDCYAELLHFRTDNPDLFSSSAEFYWSVNGWDNGRFITARNKATGKERVVAYNPTTSQKTFSYTFDNPSGKYYIMSKSNGVNPTVDAAGGKITVPQHSYVAITNFEYVGVDDVTVEGGIAPKPAIFVTLEGEICVEAAEVQAIEVYNVAGQLVARESGRTSIDAGNLTAGTYIVRAFTAQGVAAEKVVVR